MIADEHRIYLDGNSLGRLPKGTRERLHRIVDQWGEELVGGWHDWIEAPTRTGDALAEVIGASPGQVLVTDSTTVNLYKLVNAVLDADPSLDTLVTDQDNFPTDRYVLEGIARARGLKLNIFEGDDDPRRPRRALARQLPHRRAGRHGGDRLPAHGDLGPEPLGGRGPGRAEPSAASATPSAAPTSTSTPGRARSATSTSPSRRPCARRSRAGSARTEQFVMERPYEPAPGITRFLAGTPPILVLAAVEEGVRITAEAGIEALREKSIAQTELLIALHDEWLAPLGFELGSPRDPHKRGSHVSLRHAEAWPICRALIEHADVIPDYRGPDSVRLGVAPLYTRFVDVYDALDRLRDLVERGVHREVDQTISRVT